MVMVCCLQLLHRNYLFTVTYIEGGWGLFAANYPPLLKVPGRVAPNLEGFIAYAIFSFQGLYGCRNESFASRCSDYGPQTNESSNHEESNSVRKSSCKCKNHSLKCTL